MLRQWLEERSRTLPCSMIYGPGGTPYLGRYELYRPGETSWSVRLNRFFRPDMDQEVHNHPWSVGVSLILVGGYEEERWVCGRPRGVRTYRPGQINVVTGNTFHRVSNLLDGECWTLFVVSPDVQSWVFFDEKIGLATPWKDFLRAKAKQDPSRGLPRE